MTRREIEEKREQVGNIVLELSSAAIDAITNLENVTEELAVANTIIAERNEVISVMNTTIETIQRAQAPITPPRDQESTPLSNFNEQPTAIDTDKVIRFLSKTSSGGLANIKAYLNDAGVNAKRLRLEGSSYQPNENVLLINWGGGFETPSNLSGFSGKTLNNRDAVKIAANKLKTFEALKANSELANSIPGFTVDTGDEAHWPVTYCRDTLFGHSGEGITVRHRGSATRTPSCPLYVEGLNVKHEYRVHVVNGFTKIQKKARLSTENPNMEVRNLEGGWTFINEFTLGDRGRSEMHDLSLKVIECLGLDFGAVDIVRTEERKWKVLEVNTAPGITADSNIEWYSKALLSN